MSDHRLARPQGPCDRALAAGRQSSHRELQPSPGTEFPLDQYRPKQCCEQDEYPQHGHRLQSYSPDPGWHLQLDAIRLQAGV